MKKSIDEDVINIITELVGKKHKSKVVQNTELVADLSFDSLTTIRLIMALGKHFRINIADMSEDFDFANMNTVGDVILFVKKILQKI